MLYHELMLFAVLAWYDPLYENPQSMICSNIMFVDLCSDHLVCVLKVDVLQRMKISMYTGLRPGEIIVIELWLYSLESNHFHNAREELRINSARCYPHL